MTKTGLMKGICASFASATGSGPSRFASAGDANSPRRSAPSSVCAHASGKRYLPMVIAASNSRSAANARVTD